MLGQTITIVNQSGKVVKTSKHWVNIFKEAKSAYLERKAEIKSTRNAEFDERHARQGMSNLRLDNNEPKSRASSRSSKASSRREHSERATIERAPIERGYSDSFYTNDGAHSPRNNRASGLRFEQDLDDRPRHNELIRRNTDGQIHHADGRSRTGRSSSLGDASEIDMDLAYGEMPPPLPARRYNEEVELRGQMTKLQTMLDELNCVQHSVIATIDNLSKNPDAMAAVALTLAEISNLVTKMGPGVLMTMKGSFPAIVALLAAPEFMIAAGVGVGVTIIAFGGYKIIKKIKQRKADAAGKEIEEAPSEFDELQEIGTDLSHIENWRRGIAEAEAESLGTSVDGEFVTPAAGRQLVEQGTIKQSDLTSTKSGKKSKISKGKSTEKKGSDSRSERSDRASRERRAKKNKEPSGLKMLFSRKQPQPEPALI